MGLLQKELGAKIGTSQNTISMIESGEVSSSKYVLRICRILRIPPPQHVESTLDADMQRWLERGQRLYAKDPEKLKQFLVLVEGMLGIDPNTEPEPPKPPPTRSRRKTR